MIRPASFSWNSETAASNQFQSNANFVNAQSGACAEFDALAEALTRVGVRVHVFADTREPHTPDAIFPNNWVSFHADGTVVLYPMLAPNRRLERRRDILESLRRGGFHIRRLIDLSHRERESKFLEGTGSLVLDRLHRIAYACRSPRTHVDALGEFAQLLDYQIVAFDAADSSARPIYHTNVLLSIGAKFAAICAESIREDQRQAVLHALERDRDIITLSSAQMHAFAGNLLELRGANGRAVVALSKTAFESLTVHQQRQLTAMGELIVAPIPTIETLGGGSVRCMLAEIHLPRG